MNDYRLIMDTSGSMLGKPTVVKIGGKVLYRGLDAAKWLREQKDRNIKACAKLSHR